MGQEPQSEGQKLVGLSFGSTRRGLPLGRYLGALAVFNQRVRHLYELVSETLSPGNAGDGVEMCTKLESVKCNRDRVRVPGYFQVL